MSCYLRPMCEGDIAQVVQIDREAFPNQWPLPSYHRELSNRLAHYIVACGAEAQDGGQVAEVAPDGRRGVVASRLRRLFPRGRRPGRRPQSSGQEYVIGFAGLWLMADEAHLINIAVRQSHRGRGIGEMLLISVINLAEELKASNITLEVRASNTAAQGLYLKYGFVQVGVRRGYYVEDREDGILMSTEKIASASFQTLFRQLQQAHAEKWGVGPPSACPISLRFARRMPL